MRPYLMRFGTPWGGQVTVASYGVMMMLGFLVSLYVLLKRARRLEMPAEKIFNVAFAMLICGLAGARLFYVVQYWRQGGFAENPLLVFRIDRGGLVFYGGLAGGAAGALGAILKEKLPLSDTLGLIAGVGPLGHAFGRFGCFLNGCCFGRVTASGIGVRFPRLLSDLREGEVVSSAYRLGDQYISGSPPYLHHLRLGLVDRTDAWSLPVHATQLYEVAYNLVIFILLSLWLKRRNRPVELIWLYMFAYGTARFLNELFRVSEPVAPGLSTAQLICIPLAITGAVMLLRLRGKRNPAGPSPKSLQN